MQRTFDFFMIKKILVKNDLNEDSPVNHGDGGGDDDNDDDDDDHRRRGNLGKGPGGVRGGVGRCAPCVMIDTELEKL